MWARSVSAYTVLLCTRVPRIPSSTQAEPAAVPPEPPPAPVPLKGLRVLLIDDNEDAVVSLGYLLELAGAEIQIAWDGPGGLATYDACHPDAVLLDLGLPGLSGHAVAQELRRRGFQGSLIVISGYGSEEDRRRSHEVGVDLHLVKPADVRKIQDFLAAARAAR